MKWGLVLLFLCMIPISYGSSVVSINATYNGLEFLDIIAGDDIIIRVFNETYETCNITLLSVVDEPMIKNNGVFSYVFENISLGPQTADISCAYDASIQEIAWNFVARSPITAFLTAEYAPMISINNTYTLTAFTTNQSRFEDYSVCTSDFEGHGSTFSTIFGVENLTVTCGEFGSLNISINPTPYEPQLSFDRSLGTGAGFRMAVYDLNGNFTDELLVLSEEGLTIYDRDFNVLYFNNTFNHNYEMFITDMNWNGLGDIIIGRPGSGERMVRILTQTENFQFNQTFNRTFTNLNSFGAFEINNDFLKDLLIVNGSDTLWNLNIFENTGTEYEKLPIQTLSGEENRCRDFLIFDFTKNGIQDLICRDDLSAEKKIRFYTRETFSHNISNFIYSEFNPGFNPSRIFFTDINSDGNWELGVYGGNKYRFYNFSENIINSLVFETDLVTTDVVSTGYGGIDILNDHKNDLLVGTRLNGPQFFATFFYNNFQDTFSFRNSSTDIFQIRESAFLDFNNDGATDIIFSTREGTSGSYTLKTYTNNITAFIPPLSNEFDVNLSIDGSSNAVSFDLGIASEWNFNNYALRVHFSDPTNVFRNDFFDTQQNLRYYMTTYNNEYSFDVNPENDFTIQFALNRYNMILTDVVTFDILNNPCPFFEETCVMNNSHNHNNGGYNATEIIYTRNENNQRVNVNLNNITSNASVSGIGVFTIEKSTIANADFTLHNSSFTMHQTTVANTDFFFENTTVDFSHNNFVAVDVTNNGTITSTNTSFATTNHNFIEARDSVITGTNYGTIHSYNSNTEGVLNYGDIYDFVCTTFIPNNNKPYTITSDSFQTTLTGQQTQCIPIRHNNNPITYNIVFDTDFEYFPFNETFTTFDENTYLQLTPTGIPFYENVIVVPDFQNYTILENLDNVSNMQFTKDNLTIIISENYNYTNANITALFLDAFDVGFAITPFNFSLRFDTFEHTTTNPLCDISYNETHVWGLCGSSTNIVEDVFFSYEPITQVFAENNFTFDISYSNFHRTFNGTCSIDINDTIFGMFDNISLPIGNYNYNISCTDNTLPTRTALGSFEAQNEFLFVEQPVQYSNFLIEYVSNTQIDCSLCNLTIDQTIFAWDETTANSCSYTANLDAVENITVMCPQEKTTTRIVTMQPSFMHYNVGEKILKLQAPSFMFGTDKLLIVSEDTIMINEFFTNTYNFISGNIGRRIQTLNNQNLFYYQGDLFNDNKKIEVLN